MTHPWIRIGVLYDAGLSVFVLITHERWQGRYFFLYVFFFRGVRCYHHKLVHQPPPPPSLGQMENHRGERDHDDVLKFEILLLPLPSPISVRPHMVPSD